MKEFGSMKDSISEEKKIPEESASLLDGTWRCEAW
jgi:hypothetical protein